MAKEKNNEGEKHRPDIDEYFLEIADVVAKRSTCPRANVGAVLVRNKMIISTGYNGAPRGLKHCTDVGCRVVSQHCIRTTHAEQNAVAQAAYNGVSTKDTTLYCTHFPCDICLKILINSGVRRIVYSTDYRNPISSEIISECRDIEVVQFRKGSQKSIRHFIRKKEKE